LSYFLFSFLAKATITMALSPSAVFVDHDFQTCGRESLHVWIVAWVEVWIVHRVLTVTNVLQKIGRKVTRKSDSQGNLAKQKAAAQCQPWWLIANSVEAGCASRLIIGSGAGNPAACRPLDDRSSIPQAYGRSSAANS
jgi:hypothetical protein